MASYAAIPLAGTPAPRMNPYQAAMQGQNQALGVQDDLQKRQLRDQQIQEAQLQVQAQQQAQKDAEIGRQALSDSGGDPVKFRELSAKAGMSPKLLFGFDQQQAITQKNYAQRSQAENLLDIKHHDEAAGALLAPDNLPADQQADAWKKVTLPALKAHLKPEDYAQIAQYEDDPGPKVRKFLAANMTLGSNTLANAVKQQQADAATARAKTLADTAAINKPGLVAKSEQAVRSNLAGPLAAAAESGDEDVYTDEYHKLPKEEQASGRWPTPQEYDPDDATDIAKRIRGIGSTVTQQTKNAHDEDREERLKAAAESVAAHRTAMDTEYAVRTKIMQQKAAAGGRPGEPGLQFRFDAKRVDQIGREESQLRAESTRLAGIIGSGTQINKAGQLEAVPGAQADKSLYRQRYANIQDEIQKKQFEKAAAYHFSPMDKGTAEKVAEGSEITTPDGSVWKKNNGILYWDRGAAATARAAPAPQAPAQPTGAPAPPVAAAPQGGLQTGAMNPFGMPQPGGRPQATPPAGPPPASVIAKTPEGHNATGPDGVVWRKVGGKMVRQ